LNNDNSTFKSIFEIDDIIKKLSRKINAEKRTIINFKHKQDVFIYIDKNGYHYGFEERGTIHDQFNTTELDELLFWVFRSVTSSIAFEYELHNRKGKCDARIIAFPKQLELLAKLSNNWVERAKKIQNKYLEISPFDFYCKERTELETEYLEHGLSKNEAREKSELKYPFPTRLKVSPEVLHGFYYIK
jgi:hypothetical protein